MKPKILKFDFDNEKKVAELSVRQSVLSRILEGQWSSRYKGQGMEFSEYRKYVYTDDATIIDWKASLKSGETLVKEFDEEKSAEAIFLFDVGDSMLFSSRKDGKMKVEYAADLILSTAKSILKSGHAAGMVMFGDKLYSRINPNIGLAIEKHFKTAFKKMNNYGGKFNFSKAMGLLLSLNHQRLVIIIVSDFIDLPDYWYRYIEILNQKYEVIGIMIRDHRDRFLPYEGQIVLQDPSSQETIYVDVATYAEKYHKNIMEEELFITSKFKSAQADLLKLETTQDGFAGLVNFFKKRIVVSR
jgi:uncharacterized protein (DUF58 family)